MQYPVGCCFFVNDSMKQERKLNAHRMKFVVVLGLS